MVLATDALHLGWVCACSELTCALSFAIGVRSQGSFDAEVSGVASSPTRPSRKRRSAKHPARSAPTSTSITSHGGFSAPHVRMKLRSLPSRGSGGELPSFLSTELHRHFSVPLDQRARQFPRSVVGRVGPGVAQLGVSRHGRCFVVCASRSLRDVLRGAKKHQTAGIWGISVSMRVPAHIPLVNTARALRSARRRA